jgi:hypothetical protein
MFESVRADDLVKWPLMHGTPLAPEQVAAVRLGGLVAGTSQNSFEYDSALGRVDSVYLSTASFRFNYGFGYGFLLDPQVLRDQTPSFSDHDVGSAYDCVRITLSSGQGSYCGRHVKEPDLLAKIIEAEGTYDSGQSDREMALRVIGSNAFKSYYHRYYFVGEFDFFQTIERTAAPRGYNLFDYFNRNNNWPLHEEISISRKVRPEYILGHWDGGRWNEWARAKDPETRSRVDEWIRVRDQLHR